MRLKGEEMNVQSITTIIQGLTGLITILLFLANLIMTIKAAKKKSDDRADAESESIKCLLRSEITRIYNANRDSKQIHQFEFENVTSLYVAYKNMGGNSFIDRIWAEVSEWDIIP